MSELYFMVTIADRTKLSEFVSLYREEGLQVNLILLGHGTASNELRSRFGLESSEKAIFFSVVTETTWKTVKKALEKRIRIDIPGIGIVFTIPMSSIGGKRELAFLTEGQEYRRGDESELKGTERELLVVISNQGYNDEVMDAAREAGASGGTVIHARGTGMERAERFLGVSLVSEKDITFIVTKTSQKNAIMQSVMKQAGLESKAQSIVFSLPITSTAGLRLLDSDETDIPDLK